MQYKEFAADFETNNFADCCHVWLWGLCAIGKSELQTGASIETFLNCAFKGENKRIWFHNLRFDGRFILCALDNLGFTWVKSNPHNREYTTLINAEGVFYSIQVVNNLTEVIFADSLKKLHSTIEQIAFDYSTSLQKGEIDYNKFRGYDYEATQEELNYLRADVLILAEAMKERLNYGTHLTTAADAISQFRADIGYRAFNSYFPELREGEDSLARQAFFGGLVWLNPDFRNREINSPGEVVDVNSMYPWALSRNKMPVGFPNITYGELPKNNNLWIAELKLDIKLKSHGIPFIPKRMSLHTGDKQLIKNTYSPTPIVLCSVDFENLKKEYDVSLYDVGKVISFRPLGELFSNYVNTYYAIKEYANGSERANAKRMLNSLFGKFAQRPDAYIKMPNYENQTLTLTETESENAKTGIYAPVAVFTCAYARKRLLDLMRPIRENVIYCNTDSIHYLDTGLIECGKGLGQLKKEFSFKKAKYLKPNMYMLQDSEGKRKIAASGMNAKLAKEIEWQDFEIGFSTANKNSASQKDYTSLKFQSLVLCDVPGGCILREVPFTIR